MAQQYFDEEQKLMRTGRPIINSEGRFIARQVKFFTVRHKVPLRDTR